MTKPLNEKVDIAERSRDAVKTCSGGMKRRINLADLDGAILLIILGSILILKPWFDRQGLFGKAEER